MGRLADIGARATGRLVKVAEVRGTPAGQVMELPGRGSTFVVDTGPPPSPGVRQPPPLLLLHALACTGLLTWYPAIPHLRKRFRIITFDQRWHGQGIRSPHFSLEDCADDVVAVADALGIDTFIPVGYSMGSLVSQLVWRQHPTRVAGAVFGASTTSFTSPGRDRKMLNVVTQRLITFTEGRERSVLGSATDTNASADTDAESWALAQFRSTSATEVAGVGAVVSRFDSTPWIAGMDVPTSVVLTAKDRLIVPARQRRLADLLPDSTIYEVDAGHSSCVLNAEKFTPALLAACASVSARAALRARR
ncbi:MAG: alpha/beta fold hydrolase [Jatrophihabitantaceae bacterium]